MDFAAIFPFATEVGYIGLSLVSFFGSLIPFVPLPSFLLLATMSVGDKFDLHLLAILSAVTATAAKVIVFSVSYEGRRIMSEKARKRISVAKEKILKEKQLEDKVNKLETDVSEIKDLLYKLLEKN